MSKESREDLFHELMYAVRASQTATEQFDAEAARVLGLNRTDMNAIDLIDNEGGGRLTAGRLAELMGVTTAAVTAVVDRLEAKGYARRVRDEQDRRRVWVELTPRLHKRTEKIWGPIAAEAVPFFEDYSVAELKLLLDHYRASRELNERHRERIAKLDLSD